MIYNKIIFEETNVEDEFKLRNYLEKTDEKSPLYPILQKRLEVIDKIKERREIMDYTTDVKFAECKRIMSGYSYFDFDCAKHSRKKNWIKPVPMLEHGYNRERSDEDSYVTYNRGKYSTIVSYTKKEYAPKITSYAYITRKRIIVFLENKVYRCRNAGKSFHFDYDEATSYVHLIHTKSDVGVPITALHIIKRLPAYRKRIYNLIKRNKIKY